MKLERELSLHQRKTGFLSSTEAIFYRANAGLLSGYDIYGRYLKAGEPFDIVRANILIRSLQNKKTIERAYQEKILLPPGGLSLETFMKGRLAELPYLLLNGERIYVPVFSHSLNSLYNHDYEKLAVAPYFSLLKDYEALLIDPFDYYGSALFESSFTKLILVARSGTSASYYDYDAECLYFVNGQGRLDMKVALFDEYLPYPQKTHMLQRLKPVAEAYFAYDEDGFLSALVDKGLISGRLIHKATHKDVKPSPEKKDEE